MSNFGFHPSHSVTHPPQQQQHHQFSHSQFTPAPYQIPQGHFAQYGNTQSHFLPPTVHTQQYTPQYQPQFQNHQFQYSQYPQTHSQQPQFQQTQQYVVPNTTQQPFTQASPRPPVWSNNGQGPREPIDGSHFSQPVGQIVQGPTVYNPYAEKDFDSETNQVQQVVVQPGVPERVVEIRQGPPQIVHVPVYLETILEAPPKIVEKIVEKIVHLPAPPPQVVERVVQAPPQIIEKVVTVREPAQVVEKVVHAPPQVVEKVVHVQTPQYIEKIVTMREPPQVVEKIVHVPVEKVVTVQAPPPPPQVVEKIVERVVQAPPPPPQIVEKVVYREAPTKVIETIVREEPTVRAFQPPPPQPIPRYTVVAHSRDKRVERMYNERLAGIIGHTPEHVLTQAKTATRDTSLKSSVRRVR